MGQGYPMSYNKIYVGIYSEILYELHLFLLKIKYINSNRISKNTPYWNETPCNLVEFCLHIYLEILYELYLFLLKIEYINSNGISKNTPYWNETPCNLVEFYLHIYSEIL